ncbi:hypothetical protein G6F68_020976 [Rhizopus microsporus]|nr:hypothetical protein G6F68_020976 [Rhizopus microsporus]
MRRPPQRRRPRSRGWAGGAPPPRTTAFRPASSTARWGRPSLPARASRGRRTDQSGTRHGAARAWPCRPPSGRRCQTAGP